MLERNETSERIARFDSFKHVHIMHKHVHICLFHISYLHSCMSRYVLLTFSVQMVTYISRNVYPAFLAGLGADPATSGAAAGSSPPAGEQPLQRQRGDQQLPRRVQCCGSATRVLDACLVLGCCSSVLLVLRIGASLSWSWGNCWRPEPP
jgi:hypothetical protein